MTVLLRIHSLPTEEYLLGAERDVCLAHESILYLNTVQPLLLNNASGKNLLSILSASPRFLYKKHSAGRGVFWTCRSLERCHKRKVMTSLLA